MKNHFYIFFVSLVVAAAVFPGCGDSRETGTRPNIILISIDTLRQDHVSSYGYPKPTTPTLDKLAAGGVLFQNCVSRSSWTLPAHMSVMTGLPSSMHKVEERRMQLPKERVTLAEILEKNNYLNGGFVTIPLLSKHYGFARGFDDYEVMTDKRAGEVTKQALAWLSDAALKNRPFFLFLHYFDVHWPYGPPIEYLRMFGLEKEDKKYGEWEFLKKFSYPNHDMAPGIKQKIIALYDSEIRYTDAQIKKLIDFLKNQKKLDNTIIVIFSDHGEEFKEHGGFGHGHSLYSEVINVPLIMHYPPGIRPNTRVSQTVVTSDIPITLLELANIKPPKQFSLDSVNLIELIDMDKRTKKKARHGGRSIITESTERGPKRFAVIKENYKYISGYVFHPYRLKKSDKRKWLKVPEELFNCLRDPGEGENVLLNNNMATKVELPLYSKLKTELKRYIGQHIQALQLCFVPAAGSKDYYEGFIQFDGSLFDEPFVLNFETGDRILPFGKTNKYDFSLNLDKQGDRKEIFFTLSGKIKRVTLSIKRDKETYYMKTVDIPRPGQEIKLMGDEINGGCILKRKISRVKMNLKKVELSKEQINHLKALGYL
ncbi:MAG: sulfatase [Candidatus Aminicenantes bacterium]|nr:MAG: sulfatase [Candidatus Aminicenantes bacterium]